MLDSVDGPGFIEESRGCLFVLGVLGVQYLFSDQGTFERATADASGLPQASACLGSLRGKLRRTTGDITGAPSFTVSVTVQCK